MAEILGLGVTHYPPLMGPDEDMACILRMVLDDPGLEERYRDRRNWPAPLREEYAEDGGTASARKHRERLLRHFRDARKRLEDFQPDVVLIWGDDQYENFTEDIIPPFCILAYDRIEARHGPWNDGVNVWGEGRDEVFSIAGHREAGKYLAKELLERDVDVSYAYKPLHYPGFAHAFLNTILFLDYDRVGFPHPVLAFQVNCYGRRVIAQRGFRSDLSKPLSDTELDPPSPSPKRCMEVGAATARAMSESPWRVALIASSSWSHAFLVDKNRQLYPDMPADRRLYEALRDGDYETWRQRSLAEIEDSGQQELLNWYLLLGAMEELGRKPDECAFIETWAFNSNKCFATFKP